MLARRFRSVIPLARSSPGNDLLDYLCRSLVRGAKIRLHPAKTTESFVGVGAIKSVRTVPGEQSEEGCSGCKRARTSCPLGSGRFTVSLLLVSGALGAEGITRCPVWNIRGSTCARTPWLPTNLRIPLFLRRDRPCRRMGMSHLGRYRSRSSIRSLSCFHFLSSRRSTGCC